MLLYVHFIRETMEGEENYMKERDRKERNVYPQQGPIHYYKHNTTTGTVKIKIV